MESEYESLRLLRTDPTVRGWKDEFRAVLYGRRESRLRHLGGIQEYFEVLVANSSDLSAAHSTFHAALRECVLEWQPAKFQSVKYVELMLDLLAAFTPDPGFAKVAEQLRVWGDFTPLGADAATIVRLRRRALEVLRNYFPVAPPARDDSWPAFQSYVAILRDNLANPDQCGLALARLIDLHMLELSSEDVRAVLRTHPHAMRDLVGYAFQPGNQARFEWYLSQLYRIVVEMGKEVGEAFQKALDDLGAALQDRAEASVIKLRSGDEIPLQPPSADDEVVKYMESRWMRGEEALELLLEE